MEVIHVNNNRLYTLNNFFTRSTFKNSYSKDNSYYEKIANEYVDDPYGKTNKEIYKQVYYTLDKTYRNEYFYKNTLLNKLLLGVHSTNTTVALTEIPISNSIADFVLINGKGVVYEIKTELDTTERLSNQIMDYYKAFDHVAVVSYWNNLNAIKKIVNELNLPIGIYILQDNCCLKTIRKPERYADLIDKEVLFGILRKKEFEKILKKFYGYLPEVNDFVYYSYCKQLFSDIPLQDVYPQFLKILKDRNLNKKNFLNLPYELRFLGYFMDITVDEYATIDKFLNKTFGGER